MSYEEEDTCAGGLLHAFRESFEEEDTCHMRRRIHAQGDSCMPFDELAAQVFELPR
jgi:hypothetical protein